MYPAKVTDDRLRSLIREMTVAGTPPSGVALRAELARRFGHRGGVSRIYRLLGAEAQSNAPVSSVASSLLEQEVLNLRELLKQLRQREEAHQAHWGREVAQLRERAQTLEARVKQALTGAAVAADLQRDIQAVDLSAGRLDVMLRAFGPAAQRPDPEAHVIDD